MAIRHPLLVSMAVLGITLQLGCGALTDPAVRLSSCLEGAIADAVPSTATIEASCDLKLAGSYLVVLHPAGEVSDEQLLAAGMPEAVVPELRTMRIADNASIYIISTDANAKGTGTARTPLSSRTTSQNNFVKIDRLIVQAKTSQPVIVEVGGAAGARVIHAVR